MGISSVSSGSSVQTAVQVEMMKKANDLQASQVQQLLQSVQQPQAGQTQPLASDGQPGSKVNVFA